MSDYNKDKLYWLKMPCDFFKRHDMRILESMPNGKEYELFYLKLLVESIDHGGELRFNEMIPYDASMLSVITNTQIDTVVSAVTALTQLGLIEVMDDKTLYMTKLKDMCGSVTRGALAKREQRSRKNALPPAETFDGGQMSAKCPGEIEKEIEIEKDKEEKEETKRKRFLPPSVSDVEAYISENGYCVSADSFIAYYESNGWKVGKNTMKDWRAAVRSWHSRDVSKIPAESRPTKKVKVRNCWCGGKLSKDTQTGKYFCDRCWSYFTKDEAVIE